MSFHYTTVHYLYCNASHAIDSMNDNFNKTANSNSSVIL